MSTVTMKNSTKQEIFDAYIEAKRKLDEQAAMKDDPMEDQKKARVSGVMASADDIINRGILSYEIVQEYNNLKEAIGLKKSELQDLYGIAAEANSMVALINAHKDKKQELDAKYKALTEEAVAELEAKKSELAAEIEFLKNEKINIINKTRVENDILVSELSKQREREEEEYTYNLSRSRKLENDTWEDEKTAREKVIHDKEIEVARIEEALAAREAHLAELELKVAGIPELLEKATEDGIKKGKVDADKSNAFEVRAINQKNEYEQKSLKDQVARLQSDLAAAYEKVESLQNKLDDAYKQMRELATDTVKSANGVKIIDHRENAGK